MSDWNLNNLDDGDLDVRGADVHETPPDSLSILVSEIQSLPVEALVFLGDFIQGLLPPVDVQSIDVNVLIANQLRSAQALQSVTLASQWTPANQKAQTLNATTGVIEKLVKMQVEAYNIETVKALERAVVLTFRGRHDGEELMDAFKENYERAKSNAS